MLQLSPANQGLVLDVIVQIPWSLKLLYAFFSDSCPIRGQRRKPYLFVGMFTCSVSWVLLGGFLLVDLGAPRFEAVLFATLACCFSLISSFVDDLADPFGGSWTVDAAKSEVEHLIAAIAALRRDAETEAEA